MRLFFVAGFAVASLCSIAKRSGCDDRGREGCPEIGI